MTVLDIGCALGFFSIPLARMVGSDGKVICADIQEKMLNILKKRAIKAGVAERITTVLCGHDTLNLNKFSGKIDFAFAFAVVHEVSDTKGFFTEIYNLLKPGALFLIAEPTAHVSKTEFKESISLAEQIGFKQIDMPKIPLSQAVLFKK